MNGVDFVRLVFKEDTTKIDFENIMSDADASNDRYADLFDVEFQKKYGIESVEKIKIDKEIMLEEQFKYFCYNPELGEYEEVYE